MSGSLKHWAIFSFALALCGVAGVAPAAEAPANVAISNAMPVTIERADRSLRASTPGSVTPRASASLSQLANEPAIRSSAQAIGQAVCTSSSSQPAEIVALAAGLRCDPDLLFEYVYNNVEYEPLFGSNKGPLGTLLDQRGNDIDQAQLFTALLSAAGLSPSQFNYEYGNIRVAGTAGAGWLGVKNDAASIGRLLASGGIPTANLTPFSDGTLAFVDVAHVWVRVQINGTSYVFDPSFKQHVVSPGQSNLAGILGYTRSQFLADAGGSVTATSISGLSRSNIRADLTQYANNLAAYIKTTGSASSVSSLLGGTTIQYLTDSPLRQTALPYLAPSQPSGFPQNWGSNIPNSYRTCFTISMPGVTPTSCASPSSQTIQLYADQTYGRRITVFSTLSGANFVPTLLIEGAPPPNGQNTGTAQPANQPWVIQIAITHPYADPNLAAVANQSGPLTITPGGSYLIGCGWGQVNRGTLQKHRTLLTQARASGASGASEAVLGETLAVISYSWLAENASAQRLLNAINKTTTQYHHGLGITAQTTIQGQSSTQGPYVDLPFNFLAISPQDSTPSVQPVFTGTFATNSGLSSSLESAVLEQTQGLIPGMTAASTIRLIDQNVSTGGTTYFADGTTTGGVTAYFSSIRPNLTSYSTIDLATIDKSVSSDGTSSGSPTGQRVLLPVNGMQSVGAWKGAGYSVVFQTANSLGIAQKISGGLSGGYAGTNVPTVVPPGSNSPTINLSTVTTTQVAADTSTVSAGAAAQPHATGNSLISDPVDSITGAYLYSNTDIISGNGAMPYALPFERTYSSAAAMSDVGLGNGWTHTYGFSAMRTSDPYPGLGEGSASAAAASAAALYISQDLLSQPLAVQNLTVSWVISRWLTDQLTNNAVLVSQPGTNEEFIAGPRRDGASSVSYTSPLGSAAVLIGTAPDAYNNPTVFSYLAGDSKRLTFNSVDSTDTASLARFELPSGPSLTFTYSYPYNGTNYLTRVASSLGRNLSLNWVGPHVTSVSDGLGRSTGYGYDTTGNLTAVTDPLGNVTRFAYDNASHLTQIFYPALAGAAFVTNTYDGLGRINGQANANGASTTFFFAGARTETTNPAGDRRVTYQTSNGRVLKDIGILSSAVGNVFNDTPQQNGLVVTSSQYDGQGRPILTTSPEGGTTAYAYSPDFRQNLIQVTLTPKPSAGLAPLTTAFNFDPIYNKPTSITDPLGLVTAMTYDPATGNLIQMIRDAGPVPHFNSTSRFAYDGRGLLLTATDPLNVVTQYVYDSVGNPTSTVRDASGLRIVTTLGYDAVGNLLTQTDARGNTTSSTYDAGRRRLSVTVPANGGSPVLITSSTYDANGNLTGSQQIANGVALLSASQTYTRTGKVASATDANGNVTRYAYDGVDRLTSVTDAMGRVTLYGYDALSRRTTTFNPATQAGPLQTVQYTPDGLPASLTDARGNVLAYRYDGFDRLASTIYPATASVAATSETATYDAGGNVRTRTTRKGDTITYTYDTLNRLTAKTEPSGTPSVSYTYDLAGRVTSVSDNSANIVAASQATNLATSTSYDALNRPLSVTWSPVAAQAPPTSAASVSFTHRYDATNRRVGQTVSENSWLAYPGPASSTAYAANALNQYSQIGAVTPTYDANGNLTSDGTFAYAYDAESRLVSVTRSGTAVASYAYDGRGRRKSRTVGGATTIYVTGADDQEVAEYNGATGVLSALYTFNLGGGLDEVLNRVMPGGARRTLTPDIQGSIVASLDSGGTLTKIGYQAFGQSATAATSGAGPRYTGRRLDPETAGSTSQPSGLYYYRARIYSPTLGRFLQPDPIGVVGGTNLYAYIGNDPLNLTDPLGLAGIGLLAGGAAEAGLPYISAGAQDTAGAGAFVNLNPTSSGFLSGSAGLFTSTGVMATYGNMGTRTKSLPPTPAGQANGVLGAFAGGGAGVFITNASSLGDLEGVSRSLTLNLPIGSLQLSYGGGTFSLSATVGPGIGASISSYPTITAISGRGTTQTSPSSQNNSK